MMEENASMVPVTEPVETDKGEVDQEQQLYDLLDEESASMVPVTEPMETDEGEVDHVQQLNDLLD